jgi:hypothetical protein
MAAAPPARAGGRAPAALFVRARMRARARSSDPSRGLAERSLKRAGDRRGSGRAPSRRLPARRLSPLHAKGASVTSVERVVALLSQATHITRGTMQIAYRAHRRPARLVCWTCRGAHGEAFCHDEANLRRARRASEAIAGRMQENGWSAGSAVQARRAVQAGHAVPADPGVADRCHEFAATAA